MDKSTFKRIEKSHLKVIDHLEELISFLQFHSDLLISTGIDEKHLLHYKKYISTINNLADDASCHLMDSFRDYEKTFKSTKDN